MIAFPPIHSRSGAIPLAMGLLGSSLMMPVLQAQIFYWDTNGSAAGSSGGTTAPGTWGSFNTNWTTSPGGTTATQVWADGATAWFAAGANATGAYTVQVQGPRLATGVHIAAGEVTIRGGLPASEVDNITPVGSGPFQLYVESGALGRFIRLPLVTTAATSLTRSGGGHFSWESAEVPVVIPCRLGTLRFNNGSTSVKNGWILQPRTIEVGGTGSASLALDGGSITTVGMDFNPAANNIVLGVNPGVTGTFTISDDSNLTFVSNFLVGGSGIGNLTIHSGGRVQGLTKTKLILGANPGSNGTVQVNPGGELELSGENALSKGAGTAVFNLAGGTLWTGRDTTHFSTSVPITLSGASTIGVEDLSTAYFHAPLSGDGSLTIFSNVVGSNVVLTGNQPYTGATIVSRGGLALSGGTSQIGSTASLTFGHGGTGRLTLQGAAKITPGTFIRFGDNSQEGTATVEDPGTLLAAGTFLEVGYSGSGTLGINNGASVTSGSTTALGVLPSSLGIINVAGNGSSLGVGTSLLVGYQSTGFVNIGSGGTVTVGDAIELGSMGGSGVITLQTGGTLRVGGTNGIRLGTGIGGIAMEGGRLEVHQTPLTTTAPMTLTNVSTIEADGLDATFGGVINGTGALVKEGSGTLNLTATNTYSGGTTVFGDLVVAAGGALGSGPVAIPNGEIHSTGSFSRDHSVTVSAASKLTAAGFMEFGTIGTGTLAVSGGSEVSTPGSIAFGVLAGSVAQGDVVGTGGPGGTQPSTLSSGSNLLLGYLGTGGLTVGSGGTVSVGGQLFLGSQSGGDGTFTLNPGGTLNVGGTNGIAKGPGAATFNLAGGLLKVTGSSLTTSLPMTVVAESSIDTSGVEATLAGTLSGAGNLVKTGAGTLSLTAANGLTGSLIHWAGTVRATTATSLPTGAMALNGGTLDLDFGGTATVQSLSFDGAVQTGGVWGGLSSSAPNKSSRFTGTGLLNVLSSTLPPGFNSATQAGLKLTASSGALDLFAATGAFPLGGTFSGPGVTGATFDPAVAGYGQHTITYTVGGQSAAFTISVIGGLILEQEGGGVANGNLAPGGTAFAKDVLGHPNHGIAGLNNGVFGNAGSWIGDSAGSYAGISFGVPRNISRIAFGRDNTGAFADRAAGFYAVQYTTDGNPASPTAVWTTLGAVDYRAGGTPGIDAPALRHLYRFNPVAATGVRILPGSPDAAIDEIEVYPQEGVFIPSSLTLLQEGGGFAPGNLATAGIAFALNELGDVPHTIAGVNDGTYGNASSWIGATAESFVGINLGSLQTISRVAFSRDQSGGFTDRSLGRYLLQYTTAANPDASTPNGQWISLGTLDYQNAGSPLFSQPARRHLYGFSPVQATGLRLVTASTGGIIAIDEIEIYQASASLALTRDANVAVPNNSAVNFGPSHAVEPLVKTFTIRNAGTDSLTFGSFAVSGATLDFSLTPPPATALAPGQTTTFTVTFAPVAVGSRAATLDFTTNDTGSANVSISLTGEGLAPVFNSATNTGLAIASNSAPVDLAAVTGATPMGGSFSGPGVESGFFNPAGLPFGLHTLVYTRNGVSSNFRVAIVGGMDLLETGGSAASGNLALTGTAFAFDEIGAGPHAIGKLNDGLYGNSNSWIAGSPRSFAGIALSPTPVVANRIAFGRDNNGGFLDRARGAYILQYTTAPDPLNAPEGSWINIGAVDTRAIVDPHLRRLFAFPAIAATGLRLVTETDSDYIGIDEMELYNSLTPLETWRVIHFGTSSNTGDSADEFDFDEDGLDNLVEYAFALDPKNPASRHVPSPVLNAGQLEIRFNPPAGVSGITYGVQWSTTLEANDWQPLPNTGNAPEVLFTMPTANRDKLFFRHVLTRP